MKANDLQFQMKVVKDSFESYFETDETPAPGYPFRIAVILSKAKRKDLELEFLNAWVAKFPDKVGGTYTKLIERRDKLALRMETQ